MTPISGWKERMGNLVEKSVLEAVGILPGKRCFSHGLHDISGRDD